MDPQDRTIPIPDFSGQSERALNYPYPAPNFSYTIDNGAARQFLTEDKETRTPLLCIGSNISPMQLKRKFGSVAKVPVQRAWLLDHDVVFTQRIAPYGAVPAMLTKSEGTLCFLAIAWLDDEQLLMMDTTEQGGYTRETLNSIVLRTQEGDELSEIIYYKCLWPPLLVKSEPVAITDIIAEGRHYPEQSTSQILQRIYQDFQRTFSLYSFEDFIRSLAQNTLFREEIEQRFMDNLS